jgi:hypothetical protein
MKRFLHFCFLALTALIAGGATANASNIDWSYSWNNTGAVLADSLDGGAIQLSNEGVPNPVHATNSNPVVSTNLKVIGFGQTIDTLHTHGAITLDLTVFDTASGKSHTFDFTGKLGGFFSNFQAGVTFAITGQAKQAFSFKEADGTSNTYTVYWSSYTQPGPTESGNKGAIGFQVDVGDAKITSSTPEPTAMLLSVLGASFAGFSSWRLRRRAALAV